MPSPYVFDSAVTVDDFAPTLGCGLEGLIMSVKGKSVILHFPEGECCDMGGAIAYVTQRFPFVTRIFTISGGEADTRYLLTGGQWQAIARED